ncbi:carboxypeptidase regulatory-like domain-containing protein [Micromonospora sp. NBC_00858]|uniref:carboxypeptidase regulatory-like domain-containing protein n=1 Tax=Micromonospora sp. NBC_00858 TaxID=2975979 RepID=UPI0038654066|nr:carboxypeptidase regulatory-like domain-containing protein [Micromonospora sp. NBC_00858]
MLRRSGASLLVVIMSASVLMAPAASARSASAAASGSCVDVQPDAARARMMLAKCGRPVEILAERTEYAQTFLNTDGSRTLEQSIEPVRVRKSGTWVPIDTTLKATREGLTPRASVLPTVFSPGGDNAPLARLRDGGRELAVSWSGTLPAPVLEGSSAVYRNVLPDVDLRVTAGALGFSEVLVVRTRQAAANPRLKSLRFGLATKGVTVGPTAGGGLAARDTSGRDVFASPAPLMWDATVGGAEPDVTTPGAAADPQQAGRSADAPAGTAGVTRRAVMPVSVSRDALTIVPDPAMLADPRTKLPIYIDPSWTGGIASNAWTSVWSKHKSSSFWQDTTALQRASTYGAAGAGRTEDCDGCADHIIRSLFRMNTSAVKGKTITKAQFRIEQLHSWTCNPKSNAKLWLTGKISASTTWNNQPTWDSSYTAQTAANRKLGAAHGCLGSGTIEFDVTRMVDRAAKSNWPDLTVGLRAVDEGTKNQWKRFKHSTPKLSITYNTKPNIPSDRKSDGKPCAVGNSRPYVLTTTPTLAAKQSDPDSAQQSLTTWFYWWPAGGSRNETNKISQASGNPSAVSKQIPSGKLADGATYVWQARTWDGTDYGDWSATCEFTVDATPPEKPGGLSSSTYTQDGVPHGGVGVPGVFAVAPPTLRASEVKEYAYTLDLGVLTAAPTVPARPNDFGASISVVPLHDGVNTLRVWSRDHSGRYSTVPATYIFSVRAGSGPAATWTFEGTGSTAADDSGHGNTLTLSAPATRTPGRAGVGSALALNGSASASLTGSVMTPNPDTGAATPVRTDGSFTVTARARLGTVPTTGYQAVLSANGTQMHAYSLGYSGTDQRWRFTMSGSDTANAPLHHVLSNGAATAGKWTHLAATYDGATKKMTLYVNGVAQTATATLVGGFNATGSVTIGKRRWNGAEDSFFTGAVDDVRVYNLIETPAKLAELALPLQPAISFPNGTEMTAGGQLQVTFSAGGDTNVTKFRYSVGDTSLSNTVNVTAAGGAFTVTINVGTTVGERPIYAVAMDDGGRTGSIAQATFTVKVTALVYGTVIDARTYLPAAYAVVRLEPGGVQTTAGPDGSFSLSGFAPGVYTLTGSVGGRCGSSDTQGPFEIDGQGLGVDLYLALHSDNEGHTCSTSAKPFAAAETVLGLTGDDAVNEVPLPFTFPFYGHAYRSAWVDTNGVVSFTDPGASHPYAGVTLPAPTEPNGLVAPFWDDLVVDSTASVRTGTVGTGMNEQFVIEWRNVHRKASPAQRLSFQVLLTADGTVTTNYDQLDNDAERGANAVVGMEAPSGDDGLVYSASTPALATGQAVTFALPETAEPLAKYNLSGALLDPAGAPVAGAIVALDPSGLTTTTDADGAWSFTDLVADSYTISSAQHNRCGPSAESQVDLTEDTVRTLQLTVDYGSLGYACTVGASGYVTADTVLARDTWGNTKVTLPFPFVLHGKTYTTGWVNENGLISFDEVAPITVLNEDMPSRDAPNALVAPFWDEQLASSPDSVRTRTIGTAPNRAFVIEWSNVTLWTLTSTYSLSFEAMLHEDGRIGFHYGTLTSLPQKGSGATIGIESATGEVAKLYSFMEPAAISNGSITFTPAPPGTISGTLTMTGTGEPVAGATVTLDPGARTTVTGADGGYQFTNVPVGEHAVAAVGADNRCVGQYARQFVNHPGGAQDLDLSLMVNGDEFGYTCEAGPISFIPGDVVETWRGDDKVWQKNPPFPITLYGETHTTAWISSNGLISFSSLADIETDKPTPTPLPYDEAGGAIDNAVYAFFDDWGVDASSAIATKLSGSAPNRQWVVEWRNVYRYGDKTHRASFEVVFSENGEIALAYADIDPTDDRERGGTATIGIENAAGNLAYQYLHREARLASGQGVTFRPSPMGSGSLTGTVSCQGAPAAGVAVAVAGQSATTSATGTYRITNVPGGSYAVIATSATGTCNGSAVQQVTVGVGTERTVDFAVGATPAGVGYTIAEQPVTYTPADGTVLSLSGDDRDTRVDLPFPVTLYGQQVSLAWVDTNGLMSFARPDDPSPSPYPIPSAGSPASGVYPFWHDWVVDASASVRTAVRGTAPNRQFVVEWRNVYSYEDPNTRVTFQVIFDESGGFSFAYADLDGTFLERGGAATIGIEGADGTAALQYTHRQPVLRAGLGLRISPSTF